GSCAQSALTARPPTRPRPARLTSSQPRPTRRYDLVRPRPPPTRGTRSQTRTRSTADLVQETTMTSPSEAATHPTTPARARHVPLLALSPEEAARAIGSSRTFFDEHIARELRWIRLGRRKFVSIRELE